MALAPGTRIGPYEILSAIGAGGMGEVYRATDTNLKRAVAIKVLPAALAADHDRLARFQREAEVLASLNHPHIAAIYGLEESGGVSALVMELVEGEDLSRRIARGAIPIDEALPIAKQIADALEGAHDQGIIHRDLKPANIKIRADGTLKVLDFGLAKAQSSDSRGASLADSPTIASPAHTAAGVIVGTAAYMSPEQARGRAVDARADIWAFGCVLFEMLTGSVAFSGDTTTDVLAAVIQRDPDWARIPPGVPPRVVTLLRRCLQRNAKERLRHIADARFQIDDALAAGVESVDGESGSRKPAALPPPEPRRAGAAWPALWLATGAALGAVVLLGFTASRAPRATPPTPVRTVITLPPDTTLALDRGSAVALSPDGTRLVYSARANGKAQLYLRRLDRFEMTPIAGTEGAMHPFISADGQWVGFFADRKVKKVSIEGGAPVPLGEARVPRGHAWTPDGQLLITALNTAPITKIPAGGGDAEPVTSLTAGEMSHRWPFMLPDGKAILFSIWNDIGWEPARIVAQRSGSQEHKVIVPAGGGYARFVVDGTSTTGFLVYAREEGLMAARFDPVRLELTGTAVPVVDNVVTNLSGGAHFDISSGGTLAYVPGNGGEANRDLAWVTLDGHPTPALRVQGLGRVWSLSPDGTRIARHNTSGTSKDVWIDDLIRGTNTRLTSQGYNFYPHWSRDGAWLAFSRGLPVSNIYRRSTDGTETEDRLTTSANEQQVEDWSPDGTSLAYTEFDAASSADIWILTVPRSETSRSGGPGASPAARPFLKTRFSERGAAFSPDGRWIAYESNESGRFEIYVRAYPEGIRKWAVSTDGGILAAWSPSGREIYFRSLGGKMMGAPVEAAADFKAGTPRVLFEAAGFENQYSVAPDGKRLLMMPLLAPEGAPTQVHLVLNWLEELRRRVPTR